MLFEAKGGRDGEVGTIAKTMSKRMPEEINNYHLEGGVVMARSGVRLRRLHPQPLNLIINYFGPALIRAGIPLD